MAVKKSYILTFVDMNSGRHESIGVECGSKKQAEKVCVEALYRKYTGDVLGNKDYVSFDIDGVKCSFLPADSVRRFVATDWRLESYTVSKAGSALPKERKNNKNADGTKKRSRKVSKTTTTATPKTTTTATPKTTTTATPKTTTTSKTTATSKTTTTSKTTATSKTTTTATLKALKGIKVAA